jgi:hypothetical protein
MSRRSRAAGAALVIALSAGALRAEERSSWLHALDRSVGGFVSPRELSRAHAELEGISQCSACHDGLQATPDARCLDCHEDVAERMQRRIGWHGQLEGRCSACHAEHRGAEADLLGLERDTWNHELARFPLRGAHVSVDCEDCHTRANEKGERGFHAQGIPFERCADCHDDVHGERFTSGRDCGACHAEGGFRADALRAGAFDHARDAGFALEGAHERVPCAACHGEERRAEERAAPRPPGSAAPRDCAGCHEDPHAGALGRACASCHSTSSFTAAGRGSRFDHARDTEFPLDALHAKLACGACHEGLGFRAAGRECADCHAEAAGFLAGEGGGAHAAPDPHASAAVCRDCHAAGVAAPTLLDYERACLACHPAPYGSLLVSRKRIVDERIVEVEALLRARDLARRRGDAAGAAAADAAVAANASSIARSGLHNAVLSDAALLGLLETLRAEEAAR